MSDNPLIGAFLKIHEAGGIGGGMSGTKFSNAANYAPAVGAGARGAFNNITMGGGKYVRAAADYTAKNLGSLAGMSEPTTYDKELEQENEKDTAAKRDFPDEYKGGEIGATVATLATGLVGLAKLAAKKVAKTAADDAADAAAKATGKNFELGGSYDPDLPQSVYTPPRYLTVGERVPSSQPPLNLTSQMRVPKPTLKLTKQMRTEEENDSSKGNNEMSTNPYIKGFFDIEEARAKNTNIFDESKKLTAAQKKHLDKNDNDKIDSEDFEMLRKEKSDLDEAKKAKPGHNASVMAKKAAILTKFLNKKNEDEDEKIDEAAKAQTLSALTGKVSPIDDYADMIAKFKAKGGSVTKVASKLDDKEKTKLSATFKKTGGKGGSAMATGEFASMNNRDAKYNAKQANARKKSMGMKEGVEFSEEEIDFINNVMEAMPVAPTSENDSPNPTPKKKAEGSRAKGSMAD